MEIKLKKEVEQTLIESIRRYVSENMENEIGELQATLFLQYCLEEIGPCIYNSAVADAQRYVQEKYRTWRTPATPPSSATGAS